MENASKALIIAGTALILILVITAGMYLYRNVGNVKKEKAYRKFNVTFYN